MGDRIRVGILAPAALPYRGPFYRRLAQDPRIDLTVIFASSTGVGPGDPGFGRSITWDVDPLAGYRSLFLRRADALTHGASALSLRNPDVVPKILRGNYDVLFLHGYYSLTHLLAVLTQKARRRPLLIWEDQTLLHSRGLIRRVAKRALLPRLLANSRALYAGTESRRWFEHHGARRDRLFFVPNCVDNARFQEAARALKPQGCAIRREFGITDDLGPVILTVARLIPKKQQAFLLDAFRQLRAKHRCALLIVGSGPERSALEQKVDSDLIEDVFFSDFLNQSEVPRAYACADIFVLPSKEHETFGLVVNEAMNFSLPVVVSDKVGCAVDLVKNGVNGYVVSAENPAELTARMADLVHSEDLRDQFGAASARLIADWGYDQAVSGALAAIADAVGAGRWRAATERHQFSDLAAARPRT